MTALVGSNALEQTLAHPYIKEVIAPTRKPLPLAFVKLAHQQRAETFALVSATGVSVTSSFFYPRTRDEN